MSQAARSEHPSDFEKIMERDMSRPDSSSKSTVSGNDPCTTTRIHIDPEQTKNGLGQLVLTVVKLLHELLEKQAIRRIDNGSINDEEVERLGLALMRQAEEIERLRKEFHLEEEDLNLDLGPLGRLLE